MWPATVSTWSILVVGICMGDSYEGHKGFWRNIMRSLSRRRCSLTAFLENLYPSGTWDKWPFEWGANIHVNGHGMKRVHAGMHWRAYLGC